VVKSSHASSLSTLTTLDLPTSCGCWISTSISRTEQNLSLLFLVLGLRRRLLKALSTARSRRRKMEITGCLARKGNEELAIHYVRLACSHEIRREGTQDYILQAVGGSGLRSCL
jgi:hypothetical protein